MKSMKISSESKETKTSLGGREKERIGLVIKKLLTAGGIAGISTQA